MSEFGVKFHPEAIAEARSAFLWYRDRNRQVSSQFLAELDIAVDRISKTPERCPRYYMGTRYARMRQFPYLVVFRQASPMELEVVAVAHMHRRPGYWKQR